jgi:hypothetical protein
MGDGVRLAIAIALLFSAGIAFFFAFHPGGVVAATNPDNALAWLMDEFQETAGDTSSTGDTSGTVPQTPTIPGVTPAPQSGVSINGN